ncbi:MAG: hypothetical protein CMJ18_09290 [Phycisphaeraceae bacterium]|nr:hypothetical protein [Phycisphaeraceae bacterium]
MRVFIINIDYPGFLEGLYAPSAHPGLAERSYEEQLEVRNRTRFGISDAYPANLRRLGHDAMEVHANNFYLQRAWMREHGSDLKARWPWTFQPTRAFLPFKAGWFERVLEQQIRSFEPDVVLNHAPYEIAPGFWRRIKGAYRVLAAQIAAPLPSAVDWSPYDLVISSLPNYVERFNAQGVRSELFRLGFDPRLIDEVPESSDRHEVSFVGSLSVRHRHRIDWLRRVGRAVPLSIWGPRTSAITRDPILNGAYRGSAWGMQMYRILRDSRITLNHHIGIAGEYANNMRLYEATGMGAMLLTDWKVNLADMFEPDVEVATYRDPDDCVQRIRLHLDDEPRRAEIAASGQQRTLRLHNYERRMDELAGIFRECA